jgi:hypothetical protein
MSEQVETEQDYAKRFPCSDDRTEEMVRLSKDSDAMAKWFFSLSAPERLILDTKTCDKARGFKEAAMVYWYTYLKSMVGTSTFSVPPRKRRIIRKRVYKPK